MNEKGTVYPVYDNEFEIGLKGLASEEADMAIIAEIENFAPSIDGGVEEWNSMSAKGWGNAMMTSKKLSFSFSGKRAYGDPGNDYVAGLAWKSGNDVVTKFKWIMPSGAVVKFDCVVNVTTPGGGDSTAVEALEFEILCKGKPDFTPAPSA